MIFFFCIFLRKRLHKISEIWFQGLYKSATPFDAFSDSSLDNFLFTEHLYYFTHDNQVENFRHIFLRNYYTSLSEIWFQDLYKSAIPCNAFFRFITQQLPVNQTFAYFYTIKIINLWRGYHQ